jgi:DNA polymerase-3 subunit gamma/tau
LLDLMRSKRIEHCYFLFGPGGTGKTSVARILAGEFGCEVIEVDAASNSGIDEMRALTSTMLYQGFGESRGKAYIIDECHRLSANAWDSLLKSTEEPPAHVFFFFCSTDPRKIPAAMLTRGPNYTLRPLPYDDLMDGLEAVCRAERMSVKPDILAAAARAAEGSMRAALVNLSMVADCRDAAEAESLLEGSSVAPEVIDLCRALARGMRMSDVIALLKPIKEKGTISAEGARIQITAYMTVALLGAKGAKQMGYLLNVLKAFSNPCQTTDGFAPLMLAFADVVDIE